MTAPITGVGATYPVAMDPYYSLQTELYQGGLLKQDAASSSAIIESQDTLLSGGIMQVLAPAIHANSAMIDSISKIQSFLLDTVAFITGDNLNVYSDTMRTETIHIGAGSLAPNSFAFLDMELPENQNWTRAQWNAWCPKSMNYFVIYYKMSKPELAKVIFSASVQIPNVAYQGAAVTACSFVNGSQIIFSDQVLTCTLTVKVIAKEWFEVTIGGNSTDAASFDVYALAMFGVNHWLTGFYRAGLAEPDIVRDLPDDIINLVLELDLYDKMCEAIAKGLAKVTENAVKAIDVEKDLVIPTTQLVLSAIEAISDPKQHPKSIWRRFIDFAKGPLISWSLETVLKIASKIFFSFFGG